MRKSRVLLAGVAVAAAGVATSAFTASNTFGTGVTDGSVGYGSYTVTGATVSKVVYTPDTDPSKLASIEFTTTTPIVKTANDAVMTLTTGTTATANGGSTCVIGDPDTPTTGEQLITCTLSGKPNIKDFDTVALSVMPK
jgi:hypothetical protein